MSIPIPGDFAFGNIIKSARTRGWLYDAGVGIGLGLTACNAVYAYLITQEAAAYPLWLGAAMAAYTVLAPGLFGVAKSNTTLPIERSGL